MGIPSALGVVPAIALVAALAAASSARADGPPDPKDLVKAELVAETASLAPASTLWVDLHLAIKPGWVLGRQHLVAGARALCAKRN